MLHRRLTVEDAADIHIAALEQAPAVGFDILVASAPPPFTQLDLADLKRDAAGVIARRFPEAPALYAARGWRLPTGIGRIYDPSRAERVLGFRARSDFAAVLAALRDGGQMPFAHDPDYVSPRALSG